MIQRNNSERTPSRHFWQRFLLVPGLMGGLSMIGSSLVLAQTESSPDAFIDPPTKPTAAATGETSAAKRHHATHQSWRQRLKPQVANAPRSWRQRLRPQVADAPAPTRRLRVRPQAADTPTLTRRLRVRLQVADTPAPIRRLRVRPQVADTPAPTRRLRVRPQVANAPRLPIDRVPSVAKPPANLPDQFLARPTVPKKTASPNSVTDNDNAYIDTTNYNIGATPGYQAPNAVVLSERSTGCQAVAGQGLSGSLCGGARQGRSSGLAARGAQSIDIAQVPHHSQPNWARMPLAQAPSRADSPFNQAPSRADSPFNQAPSRANSPFAQAPREANSRFPQATNWVRKSRAIALAGMPHRHRASGVSPGIYSGTQRTADSYQGNVLQNGTPLLPPAIYYNRTFQPSGQPGNINTGLLFPLSIPAPITSLFGWRMHPITGDSRFHSGTDLGAPLGTPVVAAYAGNVQVADYMGGYGLTVVLDHSEFTEQTLYGHLSEIFVQPGQWVEQGTVIGRVGSTGNSTGPHLHFEIRQLTPEGWVATDPGAQLEYSVAQLVQALQTTAQVPQQTAQVPQQTIQLPQQPGS